jgi:hypothetical protein
MADFAFLSGYDQSAEPRPYVFSEIECKLGPVTLYSRPATEANATYHNEWLRRVAERQKAGQAKQTADAAVLSEARDEDRDLLGLTCATGWANVPDSEGKAVEFSTEEVQAFLKALPDWIFDRYRHWAMNPRNFMARDAVKTEQLGN